MNFVQKQTFLYVHNENDLYVKYVINIHNKKHNNINIKFIHDWFKNNYNKY